MNPKRRVHIHRPHNNRRETSANWEADYYVNTFCDWSVLCQSAMT